MSGGRVTEMGALKRSGFSKLLATGPAGAGIFFMDFAWSGPAPGAGQFFMVKPRRSSVFLGRPLSVARWNPDGAGGVADAGGVAGAGDADTDGAAVRGTETAGNGTLRFLVALRGTGTRELADMRPGEMAELSGPLGNAWADFMPLPSPSAAAAPVALVGGGVGVAPLAAFAAELPEGAFDFYAGFRTAPSGDSETAAILGPALSARKTVIAAEEGPAAQTVPSTIAANDTITVGDAPDTVVADDGAVAANGAITVGDAPGGVVLVRGRIPAFLDPAPYRAVFACGPEAMLRAVAEQCRAAGVPCFVSMERHMACGVGACLGCTIATISGNRRCCADGPVFPAEEVFF